MLVKRLLITLLMVGLPVIAAAQETASREVTLVDIAGATDVAGYVARIELDNPAEVAAALERAEQFYLAGGLDNGLPPVAFVIHGPEVEIFFKENYQRYKDIVDLAARLSAFKVVDIKVCETRLSLLEAQNKPLFPFVGTVVLGAAELDRLRNQEKYEYF